MLIPTALHIPASFWLYGQKIHVSMETDLIEEEDCVGEALYRKNMIRLQCNSPSVNRPGSHIEATFLHELIHMILYALGEDDLRKNEKLVDGMARLLHQAFITMEGAADAPVD